MKRHNNYIIMLFLSCTLVLGASLQSCEEVIDIDLNDADPALSVDGTINIGEGAHVQLSYTSDYFGNNEPKHEENAIVTLSSANALSETLTHQGNGLYTGNLIRGQAGIEYELKIAIDDEQYTGTSFLKKPTEIVKLGYKPFDGFGGSDGEQEYNLEITLKNYPEEECFFLIKYYLNDEEQEDSYSTISHEYFPKEEIIEFSPFSFSFTKDDVVTVRAYSIDEGTYEYYSQLEDIIDRHGGSSTPYNPESNMGKDVVGYFRAWSYDEQKVEIIEEEE